MGYTHYWYRPLEIKPSIFTAILKDTAKVLAEIEGKDIPLAGGNGEGRPELTEEVIWFNGKTKCGHPPDASIMIPWPTADAGGIAKTDADRGPAGGWFAGATLQTRQCNGECDYETFDFPRIMSKQYLQKWRGTPGLYFEFCKTAFRPYDVAVTAALIIAKHHLKDRLKVRSDGEQTHWFDGAMACQTILGYGLDFKLDD